MNAAWLRLLIRRCFKHGLLFTGIALLLSACTLNMPAAGTHPEAGTAAAQTVAVLMQTATALPSSTMTVTPLPAQVNPTFTQIPTQIGTATEQPTPVLTTPIPTDSTPPAISPSASATPRIPLADIRILKPGNLSKVTSPINLEASAIPGYGGQVHVDLIGEDGQAIFRQIIAYNSPRGQRIGVAIKLDFEIPRVAEAARLQISVMDASERVTSLASINLILLSIGDPEISFPGDQLSPIVLTQPYASQSVEGGKLSVSGLIRPTSSRPIQLDLIGSKGEYLGSRQAVVVSNPDGGYANLDTDIPYSIQSPTWALLVIHQADDRIPGDAFDSSRLVFLKP